MKNKLLFSIGLFLLSLNLFSQSCGPNCPGCSGGSDGGLINAKTISLQGLYMPTGEEEKGIINVKYGFTEWLEAGVGYAFQSENIIWNAKIQAFAENIDSWKPGLILGTGSIRTGTSDQSIYTTLVKSKEISEKFSISTSAGIASLTSEWEKIYGIANLSVNYNEKISVFVNFDGINFHEGILWNATDWLGIGFMMIESELPSFNFKISKQLFN